jgi:hypothetical protein
MIEVVGTYELLVAEDLIVTCACLASFCFFPEMVY